MKAVDQAKLALRLLLQSITDSFAVGLPEPFLLLEIVLAGFHLLAGCNSNACKQRIGQYRLPYTLPEVVDRCRVVLRLRDAVLALGTPREDIPCEQIHIY